jgi:hypothetical protein
MLDVICGPQVVNVGGKYEGTNYTAYEKGGQGEQNISIIAEQIGDQVNVVFQTPLGEQGKGTGTLKRASIESMSLQSPTPGCPASYEASMNFTSDAVSWSFKGQDCNGTMQGHGVARRSKL